MTLQVKVMHPPTLQVKVHGQQLRSHPWEVLPYILCVSKYLGESVQNTMKSVNLSELLV